MKVLTVFALVAAGRATATPRATSAAEPSIHALSPLRADGPAGLLSPDAIRRVVVQNLGQVTHCHEMGLARDPNIEGRVVVRFVIGGTWTVLQSMPTEASIPPEVAQCLADTVRTWRFPPPEGGGIVTVNYPFVLQRPE